VCVGVCSCEFLANIVLTTAGFRDVTQLLDEYFLVSWRNIVPSSSGWSSSPFQATFLGWLIFQMKEALYSLNICNYSLSHTVSHTRRFQSPATLMWELDISKHSIDFIRLTPVIQNFVMSVIWHDKDCCDCTQRWIRYIVTTQTSHSLLQGHFI